MRLAFSLSDFGLVICLPATQADVMASNGFDGPVEVFFLHF